MSRRSVAGWASGETVPRGQRIEKLLDLREVVERLREVYAPEGVEIWLHARNRNLDRKRPSSSWWKVASMRSSRKSTGWVSEE